MPGKFETWGDEEDLGREVYEDTLDSTYADTVTTPTRVVWLIERDDGWWTVSEDEQGFFERLVGPTSEAEARASFEEWAEDAIEEV